ncbi:MAG TPA: tetratricopeptide repeat protein [Acidobacteriaceae bacterium]|nr:tetratricopeptide repeat protein [Acidobacteriaceae bacterium]
MARLALTVAAVLFVIGCAQGLCQQENSTSAPPANAQTTPSTKGASSANNPFPQQQSEAAAKAASQNSNSADQPAAPQPAKPNKPSGSKSSTAQQNPFPEAQSEAAAKDSNDDSNSSSSKKSSPSSSSSVGYSSSDAQLPSDELGQGTIGSHEKMDTFTRDHTLDGRIEDDLNVADLYMKNGNYRGALLRYQDAVQLDPRNDTALFGTANALCKQNHTAEAMTLLKSYAKNNPQGKYALKAEKLIAHPDKCAHNW